MAWLPGYLSSLSYFKQVLILFFFTQINWYYKNCSILEILPSSCFQLWFSNYVCGTTTKGTLNHRCFKNCSTSYLKCVCTAFFYIFLVHMSPTFGNSSFCYLFRFFGRAISEVEGWLQAGKGKRKGTRKKKGNSPLN